MVSMFAALETVTGGSAGARTPAVLFIGVNSILAAPPTAQKARRRRWRGVNCQPYGHGDASVRSLTFRLQQCTGIGCRVQPPPRRGID